MLNFILRKMKKFIRSTLFLLLLSPLAAQEQVVEVTSEPPGALVVVDHLVKGRTPLTITKIAPGSHNFRVSHGPEYRPYLEQLIVRENHSEKCHIILSPITETSLKQGVKLYREGKLETAEESLQRALRETPPQPEAYWWLGRMAYERQDDDKALGYFKEYAQYFPEEPRVHLMLGDLHKRGGRVAAAYTSFKLALLNSLEMEHALDDVPPVTWEAIKQAGEPIAPIEQMRLAYLYEMKGRIPDALKWVEKAVNELYSKGVLRPYQ